MSWCFAKVNGKLAEVYFEGSGEKLKIFGHAYVNSEEYQTKKEQSWIKKDTDKFQFTFREGQYRDNKALERKKVN